MFPKPKTTVEGKIRQGRGQGAGQDYVPWTKVGDFPGARGWNSYVNCLVTSRAADTLSKGEMHLRVINEFRPEVVDLQEGYDLDWNEVLPLTDELGIKKPRFWNDEHEPLTLDLLVTCKSEENGTWEEALDFKYKKNLSKPRILAELLVKEALCRYHQTSYKVFTEIDLDWDYSGNLLYIRYRHDPNDFQALNFERLTLLEPALHRGIVASTMPWSHSCLSLDYQLGLREGTCLTASCLLIWNRTWVVDLHSPLRPDEYPLKILDRHPMGENHENHGTSH